MLIKSLLNFDMLFDNKNDKKNIQIKQISFDKQLFNQTIIFPKKNIIPIWHNNMLELSFNKLDDENDIFQIVDLS